MNTNMSRPGEIRRIHIWAISKKNDLRERNQAPDMYGSRRNYATSHNPRWNDSEFMHQERTPEPRCRQEQRTAGSSDPLIVLVQGLLDRLDHRTSESSE